MCEEYVPNAYYVCRTSVHQVGMVFIVDYEQTLHWCAAKRCGSVPQPRSLLLDHAVDEFRVADHSGAHT